MGIHQHLALRKGDPTVNVRMDCTEKVTMKNYFSVLKDTLTRHGLLSQLYNVDEMGSYAVRSLTLQSCNNKRTKESEE